MEKRNTFDFWYAVNNTEIVKTPSHHLETFGSTVLNYHLISELMDSVGQIRIRTGRMVANQPKIITPEAYSRNMLEGFGEEAHKYIDWLKEHEKDIRILQYGYTLRQESFSEHVVSDTIKTVIDNVKKEIESKNDPLSAIVVGVDTPWDVCLIKLFWQIIQNSAGPNIQELNRRRMFDMVEGIPRAIKLEIDRAFIEASKDSSKIKALGKKLQDYDLFQAYQDRFFSLVKASRQA